MPHLRKPIFFRNSNPNLTEIDKIAERIYQWDETNDKPVEVLNSESAMPPQFITGEYQVWSDTFTLGYSTESNASPIFFSDGAAGDAKILQIINHIAGRLEQPDYLDVEIAKQWISTVDDVYVNQVGVVATVNVTITNNVINGDIDGPVTRQFIGGAGSTFQFTHNASMNSNGYLKMVVTDPDHSDESILNSTVNDFAVTTTVTIPENGGEHNVTLTINGAALVKNGLTMLFDPTESTSYPGTGTTLTNIAPSEFNNGINATLDNADMFTSGATPYFSITADNVNTTKRIEFDSSAAHLPSGSTLSVFWWSDYDPSGNYSNAMAFHAQSKWTDYMAVGRNTGDTVWDTEGETNGVGMPEGNHDYFAQTQNIGFNTAAWNEWTTRFDNLVANNFYNGTLDSYTRALSSTAQLTLNRIGASVLGSNERMGNFRVGRWMLYNRALTNSEVAANRIVFENLYGSYS